MYSPASAPAVLHWDDDVASLPSPNLTQWFGPITGLASDLRWARQTYDCTVKCIISLRQRKAATSGLEGLVQMQTWKRGDSSCWRLDGNLFCGSHWTCWKCIVSALHAGVWHFGWGTGPPPSTPPIELRPPLSLGPTAASTHTVSHCWRGCLPPASILCCHVGHYLSPPPKSLHLPPFHPFTLHLCWLLSAPPPTAPSFVLIAWLCFFCQACPIDLSIQTQRPPLQQM